MRPAPVQNELFEEQGIGSTRSSGASPLDLPLRALGRFPLTIAFLSLLGITGGFLAGAIQPNQYVSCGKVLVRLGAREQMTPETSIDSGLANRVSDVGIADEVHLLTNPALYERVATRVGPDEILGLPDPAASDTAATPFLATKLHQFQSWWFSRMAPKQDSASSNSPRRTAAAAAMIGAHAQIVPDRRASTLAILYTAGSPELAQRVVQAYIEVILERHREVFMGAHQRNFIQEQMEIATREAEAASEAYSQRMVEAGVFDLEAERAALVSEVYELESQIHQDDIRLATLARELAVLAERVEETEPELVYEQVGTSTPNPRHASLSNQLLTLTDELARFGDRYAPESALHRSQVQRLQPRITSLQEELEQTPPLLDAGELPPQRVPNPRYEQLVMRQWAMDQEVEGLQVAQDLRGPKLNERKGRLLELAALESELTEMQRVVQRASARENQMLDSYNRAEIFGLIERNEHMSSLMITQEANLPTGKIGPDRFKMLVMGTAAGVLLGLGLAVLRLLTDSTVRYPETLESALGVRLLGVVRDDRRWARTGRRLRKQMVSQS